MPSLVAHHHFAVSALKKAPSHVRAAAGASPHAFRWGAQGPDIMFYHRAPMKSKVATLGIEFHTENIYKTFKSFVKHAALTSDPVLLSYLLGYACHYTLDRTAHPFVNYIAEHRLSEDYSLSMPALHKLCESDIDAAVITNFITGDQHTYEAYKLLQYNKELASKIGELYSDVAWEVFANSVKPSKFMSSMKSMIMANNFFHDEKGTRINELKAIEKTIRQEGMLYTMVRPKEPLKADCANLLHGEWIDQKFPDSIRTDSIFDIFEESEDSASSLMSVIYDSFHKNYPLSEVYFEENFNGDRQSKSAL